MFYYLDGTVAEILPYLAVIDCGGVGYACKTTNTTLAQLKKGQRGKLYTYLDVALRAWHRARARASAASSGRGTAFRCSRRRVMSITWRFSALP